MTRHGEVGEMCHAFDGTLRVEQMDCPPQPVGPKGGVDDQIETSETAVRRAGDGVGAKQAGDTEVVFNVVYVEKVCRAEQPGERHGIKSSGAPAEYQDPFPAIVKMLGDQRSSQTGVVGGGHGFERRDAAGQPRQHGIGIRNAYSVIEQGTKWCPRREPITGASWKVFAVRGESARAVAAGIAMWPPGDGDQFTRSQRSHPVTDLDDAPDALVTDGERLRKG
jgi:hypothetical protein